MYEGGMRWLVRLLLVLAALPDLSQGDVNVIKDVTLGFGQALDMCRKETGLSEEVMEEFFHFWQEDFKFEHRELGCAIICMSKHFDLLTDSNQMHHQKTDEFIRSFPNGDILSQKMITMIHACELKWEHLEDHCWRILRVAECFKNSCIESSLAPTVEMIIAEFIMEATA